jgi:cell fate regulator YaaT (PSP1 superfamily)
MFNHFLFNPEFCCDCNCGKSLLNVMDAPKDTLNTKNINVFGTKYSNLSYNHQIEEKLRQSVKLNENSDLYKLNNNLAKNQESNNVFLSNLHKNQNKLISVDEKLKFNNHSRLT